MYTPLRDSTSGLSSHHSRHSSHLSNDDIPLISSPRKSFFRESSGYSSHSDHTGSRSNSAVSPSIFSPAFRPRRHSTPLSWRRIWEVKTFVFIFDVSLMLAPCIFPVLAFIALRLHNKPITPGGETVEQAARLAPTLFPIIFAAVVGRLMRTYALWRAERGTTLGLLEQLNGSQNLAAALERAMFIRGVGVVGVFIVILWALSPVGGQSALRVLHRGTLPTFGNTTVFYSNITGNIFDGGIFEFANFFVSSESALNAILQASLVSLQLVTGRDIWGNVKIPALESMETYERGPSIDGWYDFDERNNNVPYSALTGTIISGLQEGMDINFSTKSSYFNLSCTEPIIFDESANDYDNSGSINALIEWMGPLLLRGTPDKPGIMNLSHPFDSGTFKSYLIDSNYLASDINSTKQFNIIYASLQESANQIAAFNCSVGVTHVESDVLCVGKTCNVRRIRQSNHSSTASPYITTRWPFPNNNIQARMILLSWLNTATPIGDSGYLSPIDFYLSGSKSPFQGTFKQDSVNYQNVTGEAFGRRLQALFNTAYQLGFQGPYTAQPASTDFTALELSTNYSTMYPPYGGLGYPVVSTNASTVVTTEIFVSSGVWIAMTILISFLLLLCGIASMVFKHRARSPDILGFVSSMTRDNPNFEGHLVPGSDRLDGIERARLMRDIMVQIADVKPWNKEGHITLRNLGHGKTK